MDQRLASIGTTVLTALAALSLTTSSLTTEAQADSVSDFYAGKTLTMVVPSGSGGTFHIYAQIAARHLGRHIPGNPEIITQNRPGAGGVKAASYMANAAPKDGTVIAEINPGSIIVPLLRKVKFDPRKFNWLGTLTVRTYTIASWHDSPVDTLDKLKKTKLVVGASGVGSLNFQMPTFLNYAAGTKFEVIRGYKGGGAINLAMERNEVKGRFNFYSGYTGAKPDWIKDKKVQFLATMGPVRSEVAAYPRMQDHIKGDMNTKMYNLLAVGLDIGQSFYVPEGVPADRVAALRTAFASMLKDPVMLADAAKRRLPINSRDAAHVEKVIDAAFNVDRAVPAELSKILGFGRKQAKKKK